MELDFLKFYLLYTTKNTSKYKKAKRIEKKILNIEACIHALFKDKDVLKDEIIFWRLESILKEYRSERLKLLKTKKRKSPTKKSNKKVTHINKWFKG